MFTLYRRWDAEFELSPEDFQYILSPGRALEEAGKYYDLDRQHYRGGNIKRAVPKKLNRPGKPFQRLPSFYADEVYDDLKYSMESGWIVGVRKFADWDRIDNPFYIDDKGDLIFDPFDGEVKCQEFSEQILSSYGEALANLQGRKPAPTDKRHYGIGGGQTLNSKGVGRLLAAGGVYNGNVEGFRQTAEQLGGEAPAGYDQMLNETTKGIAIAAVSVAAGFGIGRFGAAGEVSEINNLHALGRVEGEYTLLKPGPLPEDLAETFSSGAYKEISLSSDTTFYRSGINSKPLGQFFGYEQPQGVLQTRADKAVLPVWPNGGASPLDSYHEIQIPAGTKVYVGEVGYQTDLYSGGTEQVVVPTPWKIPGVKILGNGGLK